MRLATLLLCIIPACSGMPAHVSLSAATPTAPATSHMCDPPWFVATTDTIPEAYRAPLLRGYDYWNHVAPGLSPYRSVDLVMPDPGEALKALLILTAESDEDPMQSAGLAAETSLYSRRSDSQHCVVAARVLFDAKWLRDTHIDEAESVARHEAGHMLGLLDQKTDPHALMFWADMPGLTHPQEANAAEIAEVLRQYPMTQTTP